MDTGAAPAGDTQSPLRHEAAGPASRYDALLRQIVQLNADLHKTAALSQTLQSERDGLQQNNAKLKDEVKRLHERCDKLQNVLMQETEQKIESDRKHEELIAKWKRQLEAKAKAFESLQQKFAPPRDLEQLRMKIQEELEGPYQNRIDGLQDELERQQQRTFEIRREYEIIKTEYEQFAIDQGNDLEVVHRTYELQISDLKKKLAAMDEQMKGISNTEKTRRLQQLQEAASIEIKALKAEIQEVREDMMRAHTLAENEKSQQELRVADVLAVNTSLGLDQKVQARELAKAKEERDNFRSQCDQASNKLAEANAELEALRSQLKQKEALVANTHNTLSMKIRDERTAWEKDQVAFKDRINELMLKLQAAEAAAQQSGILQSKNQELDTASVESSLKAKAREQEIEKHKSTVAELEKKISIQEEALSRCQHDGEEAAHRFQVDIAKLEKKLQTVESEKDHLSATQKSSQELVSRVKTECIALRTKLKDIESDYHALQVKHRDTLHYQEDLKLDNEKMEAKIAYLEQDIALTTERLEKEKEDHALTARELQGRCSSLESEFRLQRASLKQETRAALSKALHELSKTQKKRDAYKRKCVEIHERLKRVLEEAAAYEAKLFETKQRHAAELQQLLAQLAEVESEKTILMKRQVELGCRFDGQKRQHSPKNETNSACSASGVQ